MGTGRFTINIQFQICRSSPNAQEQVEKGIVLEIKKKKSKFERSDACTNGDASEFIPVSMTSIYKYIPTHIIWWLVFL